MCINSSLVLNATEGYVGYIWDDGTATAEKLINQPGRYWVMLFDGCHYYTDTFIVDPYPFMTPVITVDEMVLSTAVPYVTYQWILNSKIIPKANQSTYAVLENGYYQVVVSDERGCIDTSAIYTVTNVEDDTRISDINELSKQINIYPNPATDIIHFQSVYPINVHLLSMEGRVLQEVSNVKEMSLRGLANGFYILLIKDNNDRVIEASKIIKE
jgi:hypothetical protein